MTRRPTLCQEVGCALLAALLVRTVEGADTPDRIAAALDKLEVALGAVEAATRDLLAAQADIRRRREVRAA